MADHSPPDPLVHPHLVVGLVHVDAGLQHGGNLVRVGKLDTLLPPPRHHKRDKEPKKHFKRHGGPILEVQYNLNCILQ